MDFLKKLSLQHLSDKQLNALVVLTGGVALLAVMAVHLQENTIPFASNHENIEAYVDPIANTASMQWAASGNGGNMTAWGDSDTHSAAQNAGGQADGWPAPRGCRLGDNSTEACAKSGSPEKYRIYGVFSIHEKGKNNNGKKAYFVGAGKGNRHDIPNWNSTWSVNVSEPNNAIEIAHDSKIELQWVCQDKQINYFKDECGLGGLKMCEDKNEILFFNDSNGGGSGFNAGGRKGTATITPPVGTTNYSLRCKGVSGNGPELNIKVKRAEAAATAPPSTPPATPPSTPATGGAGITTPTPTVSESTPHAGYYVIKSNITVPAGMYAVIGLEFTGTATRNVDYVTADNAWASTWKGTGDSVIMAGGTDTTYVRVFTPQNATGEPNETITARVTGVQVYLGSFLIPPAFYPAIVIQPDRATITIAADTAGPPSISTRPATNVTATAATLHGAGNPSGSATTAWFRYSTSNPGTCNNTFGTRTPATSGTALGSGVAFVPFSSAISGLTTGATYYYCAIGSNAGGTRYGIIRSFIPGSPQPPTPPGPPSGPPGGTDVCEDIPGDQGTKPASCTGTVPTCVGVDQELNGTQCVNLPTIVSFYADPNRVQPTPQESTTLFWKIDNFSGGQCRIEANPQDRIDPLSYPVVAASSSKQTEIINQTTHFTLTCGNSDTQSVTVTVVPTVIEI